MATVCVRLVKDEVEFEEFKTKVPTVKIAIKDGNNYTVKDSKEMGETKFDKNVSMYVQVDAPDASVEGEEEKESKEKVAKEESDFIKYNELHNKGELSQDEQTELDGIQTEHPSFKPPVATDAVGADNSQGGTKRKTSKRGRKSSKGGRKSAKRGRKSVKRGRKGKGSRRSKK